MTACFSTVSVEWSVGEYTRRRAGSTGEYDSQELAYTSFFNDLELAISGLEAFEGEPQFISFDMSSLEGDIALWRAFANSGATEAKLGQPTRNLLRCNLN